jgi:hypothetical protein
VRILGPTTCIKYKYKCKCQLRCLCLLAHGRRILPDTYPVHGRDSRRASKASSSRRDDAPAPCFACPPLRGPPRSTDVNSPYGFTSARRSVLWCFLSRPRPPPSTSTLHPPPCRRWATVLDCHTRTRGPDKCVCICVCGLEQSSVPEPPSSLAAQLGRALPSCRYALEQTFSPGKVCLAMPLSVSHSVVSERCAIRPRSSVVMHTRTIISGSSGNQDVTDVYTANHDNPQMTRLPLRLSHIITNNHHTSLTDTHTPRSLPSAVCHIPSNPTPARFSLTDSTCSAH